MSWCTIESDPGVFSHLIRKFGVADVEVSELYSMDDDSFKALQPVHGLVFLFKHQGREDRDVTYAPESGELWFANQVISNACGTQAILHVLLNTPGIDLGPTLTGFKDFTQSFPADIKGSAMNESSEIRVAHNSFARPEPFVVEESVATKDDDVFHFIAYVPVGGRVYELDGLARGAVVLGDVPESGDWFSVVRPEVMRRIEKYSATEIRFTLLAIAKSQLAIASEAQAGLAAQLEACTGPERATLEAQLEETTARVKAEEAKFARYEVENVRRQHNWLPFIVELLKSLAEKKELTPLVEAAKERAEALRKASAERKARDKAAAEES